MLTNKSHNRIFQTKIYPPLKLLKTDLKLPLSYLIIIMILLKMESHLSKKFIPIILINKSL